MEDAPIARLLLVCFMVQVKKEKSILNHFNAIVLITTTTDSNHFLCALPHTNAYPYIST
jgi:hypothetical protein